MKLLLSLSLLSLLASCTSNNTRPTAELPCRAAPATNRGLGYVSQGVGQVGTTLIDITDDTSNYGGKVADRQGRDYSNITFNAARRGDDVVYREANRYTDLTMDTVDDGVDFSARAIGRYPAVVSGVSKRGLFSIRKVYQSSLISYGDVFTDGYWGFRNIFRPQDPKPYMVGSLNDLHGGHAMPGSSWHCRLPELPVEPVVQAAGKNPYTVSK
ncbi:hypothetical protein [Prosthecobacter sp.]